MVKKVNILNSILC